MRVHYFALACTIAILVAGSLHAQAPKSAGPKTYDGQTSAVWLARLKDKNSDDTVRLRAAYALGQITPPSAETVSALIKGVDDRAQEVRWYSADSLGRLGPAAKPGVAVLLAGVKDPANDKPFSLTAAQAFGRIGPGAEDAVPWLVESLRDEFTPLRVAAALALWRINKHPNALTTLTESLAEPSGEGSYLASMALLEFGPEARPAASALVKVLGHESPDARRAAARVLGSLGPAMIAPLSKTLTGTLPIVRKDAVTALTYLLDDLRRSTLYNPQATAEEFLAAEKLCVESSLPALILLFEDPSETLRLAAARGAAKVGLPAAPQLLAALESGTGSARSTAAEALARLEEFIPTGSALSPHLAAQRPAMAESLVRALRNRDGVVRAATLRLFAELSWGPEAEEAIPILREELKSEDPLIRRYAAKALDQVSKGATVEAGSGGGADPR